MISADKYTTEKLIWLRSWTANLLSLRVTRSPSFEFVAGQFARLGLVRPAPPGATIIPGPVWRAYSIVSPTEADYLEFCSVLLPTGAFTGELARREIGSEFLVEKLPYGFLTTERFVHSGDLWMLATGTGLAPFISILHVRQHWREFRRLIIVHSVRSAAELAYREEIAAIAQSERAAGASAELVYVPVVTREPGATELAARIPDLIENGRLEAKVGAALQPAEARVMLCGNPEMIGAVRAMLAPRGFATSRRGAPGTLAIENYW
jgi:ferredoxin--NADP+ reductase